MTDRLHNQENDPRIRSLRSVLRSLPVPSVSDERMDRIARDMFAELDERRTERLRKVLPAWSFDEILAFGRPALGMVLSALVVVGIGAGLVQIARLGSPRPLSAASVVKAEGNACNTTLGNQEGAGMLEPVGLASPVRAGRQFRTGDKSALTIALEPGTGFQMFGNSSLNIIKADTRAFVALLEQGSILVEVGKRHRGQTFRILTPNAVCEITGTIFRVDVLSQPGDSAPVTALSVLEGTVRFAERGAEKRMSLVPAGVCSSVKGLTMQASGRLPENREMAGRLQTLGPMLQARQQSAQAWGSVRVISEPAGANVFLNDAWEGVTPLVTVKPAGSYRLTASYLNYQPADAVVDVAPGGEASLSLVLPELAAPEPKAQGLVYGKKLRTDRRAAAAPAAQNLVPPERTAIESSPEYIDAQAKMSAGKYADAAGILLVLRNRGDLTSDDRISVLAQLHLCFKNMGDFRRMVAVLEDMYEASDSPVRKGNILWEIAGVKADRLLDFAGAEMDLVEYLVTQPEGVWLYEAYGRLAEVQYVQGKYKAAAKTYATMVSAFGREKDIDRAIYALAHVMRQDLDDCSGAVRWYTALLKDHPGSGYAEDATFWRAECLLRMGRIREAREDYVNYAIEFSSGRWKEAVRERMAGFGKK